LEHEYELARDLDSSRIARPLALERHAGTLALVLEAGPAHTLASLLGGPMDIPCFLQIAIGLTAALAELHRHELARLTAQLCTTSLSCLFPRQRERP
jgi:hypothetical protein